MEFTIMSLEYHVFTYRENGQEQAYLFTVSRDYTDKTYTIHELWMIVQHNGQESKMRLDLSGLGKLMGQQIGGNVPEENMRSVYDMFTEILPESVKQIHLTQLDKTDDTSVLLRGAEIAGQQHQPPIDINGFINISKNAT